MNSFLLDSVKECVIPARELLLDIKVDHDTDIVLSRRLTSQIAMLLQSGRYQQSSLGAAVSEVVRVVFRQGRPCSVSYFLDINGEQSSFLVEVLSLGDDSGYRPAGIARALHKCDQMAFDVAKRLVDDLELETTEKGIQVTLTKTLPHPLTKQEIEKVRGRLKNRKPHDLIEELQLQNQELIRALEVYRNRYDELLRLHVDMEESRSLLLQSNEDLKESAARDPLTGLFNRLRLKDVFREKLQRAQDNGVGFSAIFFDVDDFKAINDTYGHLTGDRILVGISDLLSVRLRHQDWLFRFGGEEFLILPCSCDLKGATCLARQLRESVEKQCFEDLNVTCSFGVTAYRPGDDYESMLNRVDAAMYLAKDRGKNRVEIIE